MYKWFLAWRYLHTRLSTLLGVAAVMLCVAMMLVVMSVMGGFLDTIKSRSRGLHSELVLEGGSLQGFPFYGEFAAYLADHHSDIVKRCTPTLYSYGLFRVPATDWTKPSRVIGIRMDEYVQVNSFKKGLHYEHYFPGTTRLDKQGIAVVGVDPESGRPSLPKVLKEANARWRATETDPDKIAEFDAAPYEIAARPGVVPGFSGFRGFQADFGKPSIDGPERDGIIVGCDLMNIRRYDGKFDRPVVRGAPVSLALLPLTQSGNMTGEAPIKLALRYVDDSRTGIYEIDSLCVYVDFDMLQGKLGMDPQPRADGTKTHARTNQLLIGLREGVNLDEGKARIAAAFNEFRASLGPELTIEDIRQLNVAEVLTWEDIQRPLIAAVEKEKILITLLFGFMSVVAILLVGFICYMIVEDKTRDIGILKSLGASSRGVAGLFMAYATAVGGVGSLLGCLLGSVFVWNINTIQDMLANLNPALRVWSADVYSFDRIPESVKGIEVFWIAAVAVLASVLASLLPAFLASRVWPVAALRYE